MVDQIPEQMARNNFHATLIEIDGRGVLIAGQSGSGKTSLALHLMEQCRLWQIDHALVSDDQIELRREGEKVIGIAPATIAGTMELPHFGVIGVDHKPMAVITHAFKLDSACPRIPDVATLELAGIELPLHVLPARHEAASARIVFHVLGLPGKQVASR